MVFVLTRMITPFLGFGEFKLPEEIPQKIKEKITELESASATPEEYLKFSYDFITSRWHAGRLATLRFAPLAFRSDISKIWDEPGYAHCNTQNYLLFVLLAGSKFFKQTDIKTQYIFFNFFIHQYLRVNISSSKWLDVDPAGASIRGMPLGTHISWFG